MNEKLIQDIFHLNQNLERARKASHIDNAFLFFKIEYDNYFLPLMEEIIPVLIEYLEHSKKDKKEHYFNFINPDWIPLLENQIKRKKLINLANQSICEYLVKDLNMYIEAYELKNAPEEKLNFLVNFTKKRQETIIKIIKDDFELGMKTISALKSPKVQFELLHHNKEINAIFKHHFTNATKNEKLYWIKEYFCYPNNPDIDVYFIQWKGLDKIHIKFCRDILSDEYKDSKNFLRGNPDR